MIGAIRGIHHIQSSQSRFYSLRAIDGRIAEALEEELEPTGKSESPLQYDEIVEIRIEEIKYAYLNGKRAVVAGISVDDKTGEWFFSATIQTGEVISFSNEELQSTGRFLPQAVKDMMRVQSLRVRVDADSGEGILVDGNPSVNIYQYVPYPVDLNDL